VRPMAGRNPANTRKHPRRDGRGWLRFWVFDQVRVAVVMTVAVIFFSAGLSTTTVSVVLDYSHA
jgi:hypothetical protein